MAGASAGQASAPAPAASAAPPKAYGSQYSVVTLGQLNVTVIAIVILIVVLITVLSFIKVRGLWHGDASWRPGGAVASAASQGAARASPGGRGGSGRGAGLDAAAIGEVGKEFELTALPAKGEEEPEGFSRDCPVCLAEFRQGETLRRLDACGHAFHQECIDAWLARNVSCPVCRTTLAPAREHAQGVEAGGPLSGAASDSQQQPPAPPVPEVAILISDASEVAPLDQAAHGGGDGGAAAGAADRSRVSGSGAAHVEER